MTTAQRPKPSPPPEKDPNVPRPHASQRTSTLLEEAARLSGTINRAEREQLDRKARRKLMFAELERRGMSYRAIAAYDPEMPSNVTISRIMRSDDPKPPVV